MKIINVLWPVEHVEKNRGFKYLRNDKGIRLESELDGSNILRTYKRNLTTGEIIGSYKNLQDVEWAFCNLKSPLSFNPSITIKRRE
jgi:hypothetical protein